MHLCATVEYLKASHLVGCGYCLEGFSGDYSARLLAACFSCFAAGSAAWKKEKRLADNRASAARSRALARYHSFDSDRQIAELQRTIVALRDENVTLRSLLLKHAPSVVLPLPNALPSVQPPASPAHPSFLLAPSAAGSSGGSDTSSTAASDDEHSVIQRGVPAKAGRKAASASVRAQQMQLIAAATAVAASKAARLPRHAEANCSSPALSAVSRGECSSSSTGMNSTPTPPPPASLIPGLDEDGDAGCADIFSIHQLLVVPAPAAPLAMPPPAIRLHSLSGELLSISFPAASAAIIGESASGVSGGFDCSGCGVSSDYCFCANDGILGVAAAAVDAVRNDSPSPCAGDSSSGVGSKRRAEPLQPCPSHDCSLSPFALSPGPLSMALSPSPRAFGSGDAKRSRAADSWRPTAPPSSTGAARSGGLRFAGGSGSVSHGLLLSVFCIALCGLEPSSFGELGTSESGSGVSIRPTHGSGGAQVSQSSAYGFGGRVTGRSLLSVDVASSGPDDDLSWEAPPPGAEEAQAWSALEGTDTTSPARGASVWSNTEWAMPALVAKLSLGENTTA